MLLLTCYALSPIRSHLAWPPATWHGLRMVSRLSLVGPATWHGLTPSLVGPATWQVLEEHARFAPMGNVQKHIVVDDTWLTLPILPPLVTRGR